MRLRGLATLLLFCSLESIVAAQEPTDKSAVPASLSRPCSAPAVSRKDKAKAKPANPNPVAPACLEALGSLVELHEFFQSYVREQHWRIGGEKIAEDSWIFARYLDKDELLQFAKEGLLAGHVTWSEGKGVVQVTAHELDAGFTRVEVSARFQGSGQNIDRFAPPRDSWDLDSNGALEKLLISALEAHLKSIH